MMSSGARHVALRRLAQSLTCSAPAHNRKHSCRLSLGIWVQLCRVRCGVDDAIRLYCRDAFAAPPARRACPHLNPNRSLDDLHSLKPHRSSTLGGLNMLCEYNVIPRFCVHDTGMFEFSARMLRRVSTLKGVLLRGPSSPDGGDIGS